MDGIHTKTVLVEVSSKCISAYNIDQLLLLPIIVEIIMVKFTTLLENATFLAIRSVSSGWSSSD